METVIKVGRKAHTFHSLKKLLSRKFTRLNCRMAHKQTQDLINDKYIRELKQFIPKLSPNLHKGQCGRIGVIGGSKEYTGAPYFAGISSLKLGADLVYVFCCRDAATVIKSYSPELIVLPILDEDNVIEKIKPWLSRLHALVIGPGLGRDSNLLANVSRIISLCNQEVSSLPLVIDADGIYLVTENISLVQTYTGPVILTPNAAEYSRLSGKFPNCDPLQIAIQLNAVILQKGLIDVITNGICSESSDSAAKEATIRCDVLGSNRRCGGQGDILSGCTATFLAWFHLSKAISHNIDASVKNKKDDDCMGYSLAAYGACVITRICNRLAFQEFGRSMTASDMICFINKSFTSLFEE